MIRLGYLILVVVVLYFAYHGVKCRFEDGFGIF